MREKLAKFLFFHGYEFTALAGNLIHKSGKTEGKKGLSLIRKIQAFVQCLKLFPNYSLEIFFSLHSFFFLSRFMCMRERKKIVFVVFVFVFLWLCFGESNFDCPKGLKP